MARKIITQEHAKSRIMHLRTLASISEVMYEPLRVFKEIEEDSRCKALLSNSAIATQDEKAVQYYNEHIRNSSLSEKDKKSLII